MTKQDYYELLCQSATDGTFPSGNPHNGNCYYRWEGCKKCAVGLLISDEKYREGMEHRTVNQLLTEYPDCFDFPDGLDESDLRAIQLCHDRLVREHNWDPKKFIRSLNHLDCFREFAPEEVI